MGFSHAEGFAEYIESLNKIATDDLNSHYLFKTKSTIEHIYQTLGPNLSKIFERLLNNKNIYFFDDKKLINLDLETHQLISVSEICVSTSLSS